MQYDANGALIQTEIPGLKLINRGKVRDVYDLGDALLFVATDRLSAFDVVMPNGVPRKGEVLTQIFTNFHPEVFMQFVVGYKGVFVLMVVGYILHFMPKSAENGLQAVVTRSPLLVQAVMLAIAIFVVVQFKSAGVQPFIYFQF